MGDTIRGNFKDISCSDCGEKGCEFKHGGPLVPEGEFGSFCSFCWTERNDAYEKGENPRPLGIQPPGIPEEFLDKKVRVTTKSGSVYELALTEQEQERIVSCDKRELRFTRVRVICLVVGKSLFLRPRDGSISDLWWTSPVVSIMT